MSENIRTRPTTQEFRDNWEATFGKKEREFCVHCGAGVGEHRREGEGTCPECDPEGLGFQGGAMPSVYDDKFAQMREQKDVADIRDDLRDEAERLWEAFMTRLTKIEGLRPQNFLGGVDRYKEVFMAEYDDVSN